MKATEAYYKRTMEVLEEAFAEEAEPMERAAMVLAEANREKKSIFAFGCNHAGLITQELFYRTGGMVTVNPVRVPGMLLEVSPITMSSEIERLDGYGQVIFNSLPTDKGDVIIIHSVSGRNAVPIDMAKAAKEKGLTVIVMTNMNTTTTVSSRHRTGKKLYDYADILIDNHGDRGDASIQLEGFVQKIGPTSTVVGAAILNAIVVRACEILMEMDIQPPVFMSGNIDGGDAYNKEIITQYREHIFYM